MIPLLLYLVFVLRIAIWFHADFLDTESTQRQMFPHKTDYECTEERRAANDDTRELGGMASGAGARAGASILSEQL